MRTERCVGSGYGRSSRSQVLCRVMKPWEKMQPDLYDLFKTGEFKVVAPEDVLDEVEAGKGVLVDVRLSTDFEEVHAITAVNVPLFQSIQTVSMANAVKSIFYALNGVKGTEENPTFLEDIKKVYSGMSEGQKMYIMCDSGGTCEAVPGFLIGKQSRSLQAVWKAVKEAEVPANKVAHVKGGMREWAGAASLGLEGNDLEAWKKKAGSTPV